MEEQQTELEFVIPKFRQRKSRRLYSRKIYPYEDTFLMNILIHLYPNGDTPENEGYVSIIFKLLPYTLLLRNFSFNCTVSIVDANKELRFLQSFGMEWRYELDPEAPKNSIGLDKFIKRDVLLESSKEFLPDDTLKLRCFCVSIIPREETFMRRQVEVRESWFVSSKTANDTITRALKLRNPDSVLCTKLREHSDFFKCLFKPHTKEMADGSMPIDEDEYATFFSLMRFIRFETLKHNETFESYCDLYITANKYLLLEQKEIFSTILKRRLSNETAAKILVVADMCFDPGLRQLALQHVILNWDEVRTTEGWEFLRQRSTDLAKEVSDLVENNAELNLDTDETEGRSNLHAAEFDFYQ